MQTNPPETPRARQIKYEALVSKAIAERRYGQMLWAELARDYNAAIANVLHMWRQVDHHFNPPDAGR